MGNLPRFILAVSWLVPAACDSKEQPNPQADQKAAEEAEMAKRIEERRLEREAKAAAEKKAAEETKATIESLCVVPEDAKKPKNVEAACKAAADAQIEFLKRQYAEEPDKLAGVEKNAALQKANLMKMCTSTDVALGLENAFENAPMGYGSSMNDIIATCMQQLGRPSAGAAGAAVPPKPR